MLHLAVNSLLEWVTDTEARRVDRVLWTDSANKQFYAIDIFDDSALPRLLQRSDIEAGLENGSIRKLTADPYSFLHEPDSSIKESRRKRRDTAWRTIEPIIALGPRMFDPAERGPLIEKIYRESGVSKKMLYKYLRRYWKRGQVRNALLPDYDNSGGKGKERKLSGRKVGRPSLTRRILGKGPGINVGPKEKANLLRGIKKFKTKGLSLNAAYKKTLAEFFNDGYRSENGVPVPVLPTDDTLPTYRQFRYVYEKWRKSDPTAAAIRAEGAGKFNLRSRAITGASTLFADGPGKVFQIDSTVLGLYLVSELDRQKIVGRPTLYILVDVFSHLIAGFHLTLEPPSYLGAMLALANATENKQAFCRSYGIDIEPEAWPSEGLPERILADRGEMESYMANELVTSLGIQVSNTAPYRPDLKGMVERVFKSVDDTLVRQLPGAVDPKKERGERDYRLDAMLNLRELNALMIRFIVDQNGLWMDDYRRDKDIIADSVEPRPADLWTWGITNRSGHLRELPPDVLRRHFLPTETARVTEQGIVFRKLAYTCQTAAQEQWFVRARTQGSWIVDVTFDPRRVDVLFLKKPGREELEPCGLLPKDHRFTSCSWKDIDELRSWERQKKESCRNSDNQKGASFAAHVKHTVDSAREEAAERQPAK